jgi:ribosomal protein L11
MTTDRPTQSDLLMRIVEDIAEIKATVKNYAELERRVRKIEGYAMLLGILTAAMTATIIAVITKAVGA